MVWTRNSSITALTAAVTACLVVVAAWRVSAGGAAPSESDAPPLETTFAANMKRLPGGTFTLVNEERTVTVRPFWLDETAVTAGAYAGCVKAGKCVIYSFQEHGGKGLARMGSPTSLTIP